MKAFGERWTKGELHEQSPDHVPQKKTSFKDAQILDRWVYKVVGHIALSAGVEWPGGARPHRRVEARPDRHGSIDAGSRRWQTTEQIKSDPATAAILVIAVTAHATRYGFADIRDCGADELLAKPCLPDDLLRCIRGLLSGED